MAESEAPVSAVHRRNADGPTPSNESTASLIPYLLLTLAPLSWSGNWVIGRALRFDAPPGAITFWRWAVAFVLLLPFTYPYLRDNARLVFQSWKILCALGLLATVLQHIPYYIGLRHTTATNGALLNATAPIFIIALSSFVGERLTKRAVIGGGISLSGVLAVVSSGSPMALLGLTVNRGDIFVLGGTLSWAAYTVLLRWWPSNLEKIPALTVMALVGVVGTAPLYAYEIASGRTLPLSMSTVSGILYIGIFATVVGYVFWNGAVTRIGPGRAGPFMYLMIVFTPLLSIVFLDERLYTYHFVGAALIVIGIIISSRGGRRSNSG